MTVFITRRTPVKNEGELEMSMIDPNAAQYPGSLTINNVIPQTEASQIPPPGKSFSEEEVLALIEKTRKEEKDKLYPQMQDFDNRIKEFEAERLQRIEAATETQRLADEEAALRVREESTSKDLLVQMEERFSNQLGEMQQAYQRSEALRVKERELYDLMEYKQRRMAEEMDNIDPRFTDFVRGNSEQELEASIADMRGRTDAINAEVAAVLQQQGGRMVPPTPFVPVSGAGPTLNSSLGEPQTTTMTPQDIAALTPEEYVRVRPELMRAQSDHVRQHGYGG
jgi:hypothetical protein